MLVYNLPTKPKLVTRKYRRLPMQVFSMNAPTFLFHLTLVLFEHGILENKVVFTLVLLEQTECLTCL